MNPSSVKYQGILAQGWIGMLSLLITMFITDIIELLMKGDVAYTANFLRQDPGMAGLWLLVGMICLNVLMQMGVRIFTAKPWRWLALSVTVLYTLFFFMHQAVHLVQGAGIDLHFLLDVTHNIVGIGASWAAYQWAKQPVS